MPVQPGSSRGQASDGEDQQAQQPVGLGVRVLGQAGVHRARLDDGAARRGQPAEPRAQRLPPRRTRCRIGRADVGGRLERPPDRVGVGGRVQCIQSLYVQVHARAEVVALPAVHEDAGVQRLAALDPRDDPQHRVLEGVPASSLGDPLGRRRAQPRRPVLARAARGGAPPRRSRPRRPARAARRPGRPAARAAGRRTAAGAVGRCAVRQPVVGHVRQHLLEQRPGHPRRQRGIGGRHVRLALDQRVRRRVVGTRDGGRGAGPVVVEGQRRAVVDQLRAARARRACSGCATTGRRCRPGRRTRAPGRRAPGRRRRHRPRSRARRAGSPCRGCARPSAAAAPAPRRRAPPPRAPARRRRSPAAGRGARAPGPARAQTTSATSTFTPCPAARHFTT